MSNTEQPSEQKAEINPTGWFQQWIENKNKAYLNQIGTGDFSRDKTKLLNSIDNTFEVRAIKTLEPEKYAKFLEQLENTPSTNYEEFFTQISTGLSKVLPNNFSKDNFIELLRKKFNEEGGLLEINENLSIGFTEDNKELQIHIPPSIYKTIFSKNEILQKSLKLKNNIQAGLKEIAFLLKKWPEVEHISATSPLLYENSRNLEKIGFEIRKLTAGESEKYFQYSSLRLFCFARYTRNI